MGSYFYKFSNLKKTILIDPETCRAELSYQSPLVLKHGSKEKYLLDLSDFMTKKNVRYFIKNFILGASLVAQWLRICLLMQGSRVRALVWEDPTCRGATGPVSHNY